MVKCSAYLCKSTTYGNSELTFHRFPKDQKLCDIWVSNMKMKNWKPRKSCVLCSKHFEEHFMDKSPFRTRLRTGAVPTLFEILPDTTTTTTGTYTSEDDFSEDDAASGSQSEINSEQIDTGIPCNVCGNKIVGFRYTCVQCSDLELCSACEARRHPAHYVLRIPAGRPQWEVSMVVQRVREEIARSSEVLPEPEIIKTEIKEEAGPDPLQGDVDSRPHASNVLEQSIIDFDIVKEEPPEFEINNPVPPSTVVEARPITPDIPPLLALRPGKRRSSSASGSEQKRRGSTVESRGARGKSSVVSEGSESHPTGSFSYEVYTHNAQHTDKHKTKAAPAKYRKKKYGKKSVKKKS